MRALGVMAALAAAMQLRCTTEPVRMFNVDDQQDPECYARYGGEWGYCDQTPFEQYERR